MITDSKIRDVMRSKHCDYSAACSWLGKRGAAAKAAKKRRTNRVALLQAEADRQEAAFLRMRAARPDLY